MKPEIVVDVAMIVGGFFSFVALVFLAGNIKGALETRLENLERRLERIEQFQDRIGLRIGITREGT